MIMSICVEIGRERVDYFGKERIHGFWTQYWGKSVIFGGKGVRISSYVAPTLQIECTCEVFDACWCLTLNCWIIWYIQSLLLLLLEFGVSLYSVSACLSVWELQRYTPTVFECQTLYPGKRNARATLLLDEINVCPTTLSETHLQSVRPTFI